MPAQTRASNLLLSGLLLSGLVAASAPAQNALDRGATNDSNYRSTRRPIGPSDSTNAQGGNALDANGRVGSGGVNAPGFDWKRDIALRNAIITGNVGQGRAFRGDVGYTAAEDFRGATGSDDLFRNQREATFSSSFATQDIRGLAGLQTAIGGGSAGQTQGFGGQAYIRRSSAGEPAQQATGSAPVELDPYGLVRGSLRSTSSGFLQQNDQPSVLSGARTGKNGKPQFVTASPLQSVKNLQATNPVLSWQERLERPSALRDPATLPSQRREAIAEGEPRRPAVPGQPGDLAGGPRPTPVVEGPVSNRSPFEEINDRFRAASERYLARPFGQPAEPIVKPDATAPTTPDPSKGTPGADGIDASEAETSVARFEKMLDALRADLAERLEAQKPDAPATPDAPSNVPPPIRERTSDEDPEARDEASPGDQSGELQLGETAQERIDKTAELLRQSAGSERLNKLLLESGATDIYSLHVTRGQEAMALGRWFDAEERFTSALRVRSGDPMAAAGRINAQIGAGLYLSAALNLRTQLAAYPQLAAVRYDDSLFPDDQRVTMIRDQLRERAQRSPAFALDAALLMAYMGYQRGRPDDIREAITRLDEAHAQSGTEPAPLETLLRKVWAP